MSRNEVEGGRAARVNFHFYLHLDDLRFDLSPPSLFSSECTGGSIE